MRITYLDTKTVQTKIGEKQMWKVTVDKNGNNFYFDAWCGKWNENWKVGDDINPEKSQWKSREYNGKTYWTLNPPESAYKHSTNQSGNLSEINEKLDLIISLLQGEKQKNSAKIIKNAMEIMGGKVVDEIPVVEEEITLNKIPF